MNKKHQRSDSLHDSFAQFCLFIGMGAVLGAVWFYSLTPILVAAVGIFVTLGFFNGLGT